MSAEPCPLAMTCSEAEDLLPLVVDGVIDEQCEPDLFAHLASCPTCQASLADYDLIDLALSGGHSPLPAHKHPEIIHYRIPGLWALAASVLLASAFGFWLTQASPSHGPAPTLSSQDQEGIKILEVLPAVPGQDQPVFVIQDGGKVRVISGSQLDGGNNSRRPAAAKAVSNERYPQQIRQLGSID